MRRFWHSLLLTVTGFGLTACGAESIGVPAPADRFDYPISMAVHPTGSHLYVVNAGFARQYLTGTISVLEAESGRILENATTEIELFGGELELFESGGQVFGVTTSRENGAVILLSIDAERGDSSEHVQVIHQATSFGPNQLAEDPYAVSVDSDGVMIGHLGRGAVSRWSFGASDVVDELTYRCALSLSGGVTHIARHPATKRWYVTDRSASRVYVLEERSLSAGARTGASSCELVITGAIDSQSFTTRGLAFNPEGSLLFLTSSGDDSLRVFDVSVGYAGRERNRLIKSVPLGANPAVVRVAPDGHVFVSLFGDERIVVFDPKTLTVIGRINVERTPYDIRFGRQVDGLSVAFVTHFEENKISVVDIDPESSARFSVLRVLQ